MRWRNNTWVMAGGAALVVVVMLSGGYLWFSQRSPEHRLSEICGGMLPVDATLGMIFHAEDLKLEDKLIDTPTGGPELSRRCRANNMWVTIEPVRGSDQPFGPRVFKMRYEHMPVPLGSGWTGFVVRDDNGDTGEVLLDCADWGPMEGEGLLVTVENSNGADMAPENRTDLARVLTGTVLRAAGKTGCDAEPGSRIEAIAPLPPETPSRVSDATGTCKGMTSRPSARETPAGMSPAEYCVLEGGLALTAMYGPYPKIDPEEDDPAGINSSSMWGTATCKGILDTAYYRAVPRDYNRNLTALPDDGGDTSDQDVEPPTDAELADLARFAEASAERHGCEAPVLPRLSR